MKWMMEFGLKSKNALECVVYSVDFSPLSNPPSLDGGGLVLGIL